LQLEFSGACILYTHVIIESFGEQFYFRQGKGYYSMPTVLREGPYRFFFYSGDREEPPHIHVERDDNIAKFWLEPVRLQNSIGFNRREINRIRRLVEQNRQSILEHWHEFFDN
jgi:hypothetical protein